LDGRNGLVRNTSIESIVRGGAGAMTGLTATRSSTHRASISMLIRCVTRVRRLSHLLGRGCEPRWSKQNGSGSRLRAPQSSQGPRADERPTSAGSVDIVGGAPERCRERVHMNRRDGRPSASPAGAPGRASSHDRTAASMSASDASGLSRRSLARCICSPNSYISRASLRRRAAALSLTPLCYRPGCTGTRDTSSRLHGGD
jgi:hypothetical protein